MLITKPGPVSERVEMLGSANLPVYVVRGKKWAVIDTGMSILGPQVVKELMSMPESMERMAYLAVTHSHFDHVGSLPALMRAFPDAEVVASKVCASVFRKPSAMAYIKSMNDSFVKMLNLEEQHPGFDFSFPDEIHVNQAVGEGDSIDLGDGVTIDIYDSPGHSRCSIILFLNPDRALFSGESAGFYNGSSDVISEGLSDYSAYLDSLRKMRRLRPATICLPHNGVLVGDEAKSYFDLAIEKGEEFRSDLSRRLGEGQSEEQIIEEVTAEKYRGPITYQPKEVFIGNLRAMIAAVRREEQSDES